MNTLPPILISYPFWTPLGRVIDSFCAFLETPVPLQVPQGYLIWLPLPLHLLQVVWIKKGPYRIFIVPFPPHVEHLVGVVPGLHLEPLQVAHVPFLEKLTSRVEPLIESIKSISRFRIISDPFWRICWPPKPALKKFSKSLNGFSPAAPLYPPQKLPNPKGSSPA